MRNTDEKMASQTWPNGGRHVAKWGEASQEALHPRLVESSAVNWRLTHILRGQGAIFRLTCFNEGTLGSKNHLVSFKLLTILTDQGHIGYMFKTSPSPVFFRRGPEVRFFKKLTN